MKRYVIEQTMYIETSKGTIIMDAEDSPLLKGYCKHVKPSGYVVLKCKRAIRRPNVQLHRLVTKAPSGMVVDHINGNPLDNRKANLRVCTGQENARNNKGHSNRKNPYKGVCFEKNAKGAKKWRAYTRIKGKRLWFGYHMTAEEAAMEYNIRARELFGEFACLNVIDGVDQESGVPIWALQAPK